MSPIVKQQTEKKKLPAKYWLLIFGTICVLLMALTFLFDFRLTATNVVVGYTLVPFQKGLSEVGLYFASKSDMIESMKKLSAENDELRAKVDALVIENASLQQDKYELSSLRELYQLDNTYADYKKTGARVISGSGNNWFNTFGIDKGTKDGIKMNMNVMAGSGLVGRITDVGPNWAKVSCIIDDTSNVSCMVLSSSDTLMVSGDLEAMDLGYIRFSQLEDPNNRVVVGDKVVTSNISDKYVPGILVGYISYIETDSNNITKSGYITPVVDFKHLSEVLVILEEKEIIPEN